MILISADKATDESLARMRQLLSCAYDARVWHPSEGLPLAPLDIWCVVLVGQYAEADTNERLAALRRVHPDVPRVVACPRHIALSLRNSAMDTEGIAWLGDGAIVDEIRRVRALGIRAVVQRAIENDAAIAPLARKAMLAACRQSRPYRTVSGLTSALGVPRSTLWRAWRTSSTNPAARLEDMLAWLVLVEAVARKVNSHGWIDVASRLGLHEQSLGRIARRVSGHTLPELAIAPELLLGGASVRRYTTWLVGRAMVDNLKPAETNCAWQMPASRQIGRARVNRW